jgi:hypothetical protein
MFMSLTCKGLAFRSSILMDGGGFIVFECNL